MLHFYFDLILKQKFKPLFSKTSWLITKHKWRIHHLRTPFVTSGWGRIEHKVENFELDNWFIRHGYFFSSWMKMKNCPWPLLSKQSCVGILSWRKWVNQLANQHLLHGIAFFYYYLLFLLLWICTTNEIAHLFFAWKFICWIFIIFLWVVFFFF